MQLRELTIAGGVEFTPKLFPDDRGLFIAPFQEPVFLDAVGHPLRVAQTNHSVSRRGTIRGVHFADVPPGQAKYVYCVRGALLDVIVDVRVGSPTFGHWEAVRLDTVDYRALYLAEGLGHAFVALENRTEMIYLCSEGYNPTGERGISPLDPALGLPWADHLDGADPVLSGKDRDAPTLAQARESGILPDYGTCLAYYEKLRS